MWDADSRLISQTFPLIYPTKTYITLFTIRCREHTRYIKNNDLQSAYALHILQNRHEYGLLKDTTTLLKDTMTLLKDTMTLLKDTMTLLKDTMTLLKDTMTLLKPIHKPSMLIPYEQLLIQTFHQNGTLIPEQNCSKQNPLFLLATEHRFT